MIIHFKNIVCFIAKLNNLHKKKLIKQSEIIDLEQRIDSLEKNVKEDNEKIKLINFDNSYEVAVYIIELRCLFVNLDVFFGDLHELTDKITQKINFSFESFFIEKKDCEDDMTRHHFLDYIKKLLFFVKHLNGCYNYKLIEDQIIKNQLDTIEIISSTIKSINNQITLRDHITQAELISFLQSISLQLLDCEKLNFTILDFLGNVVHEINKRIKS